MITITFTMALGSQPAGAQADLPNFERTACETFNLFESAPWAVEGEDVECGYLTVPENRRQPQKDTIKLGVLIIKSDNPNPSEPLVMTQGGPGGSGIDLYSSLASGSDELGQILRADRDLVIFEQRGTLYSQPFLSCEESLETDLEHLEEHLAMEEELLFQKQAYQDCRERLESDGVDLAAYNSLENADDIADLAQALGYDQINYYGVSYGTQLGQHLMNRHPDLLNSVILDGVVALDINPNQKIPWAFSRSLREFFQACQSDEDCRKNYPDLEKTYFETVEKLDQDPARVELLDPDTGDIYQSVFDGEMLSYLTTQLLYATEALPLLPKMIYDARQGVFRIPARFLPILVFDRTFADGMYMTVTCAEDFDFTVQELDNTDAYPSLIKEQVLGTELIKDICADFRVPELGPQADQPVQSDIPALLLSGFFDPVTPPEYARQLEKTLSSAYSYTFPANGHGALLGDACAANIVSEFLQDPAQPPDTSCIEETSQLTFYTPSNTIMSPAVTKLGDLVESELMRLISGGDGVSSIWRFVRALGYPILLVYLVILFPVLWVLSWLVNRLRSAPREKRILAQIAPWVGLLNALAALMFTALYLIQSGMLLMGTGGYQSLVGASRGFIWIYLLPWMVLGLTVILAVLAVLAWVKGYWGTVRRVYYSFNALAALLFTLALFQTGFMWVVFG
jgi:pimeloyl-ACP methyl ester carboxylesterase